jgi:ABC-2 type transport system ATP-binding protein
VLRRGPDPQGRPRGRQHDLEEERRAQRKFLELEIAAEAGAVDAFTDAVAGLGCECASFAGGRVKVVLPDGLEIRRLYAAAADHDVQIRRLSSRRDSLEDIFLKAMEAPAHGGA